MSMPKKRKRDNDGGLEEVLKSPPTCCILHVSGIQHLYFTPLSKVKGSATENFVNGVITQSINITSCTLL